MTQGDEFKDGGSPTQATGGPFSADLKDDFSENFAPGTNAVSRMLGDGGFVGENKTRLTVLVGVLLLVIGGAVFYLSWGDDYEEEDFIVSDEGEGLDPDEEAEDRLDGLAVDDQEGPFEEGLPPGIDENSVPDFSENEAVPSAGTRREGTQPDDGRQDGLPSYASGIGEGHGEGNYPEALPEATVPPSLTSPADGMSRTYDETTEPPLFTWAGSPGGWLAISEHQSMKPLILHRKVEKNSLKIRKLMPGKWFWQVTNKAGASQVRSFMIQQPVARQLNLRIPSEGASLAGTGGVVVWTGDQKVSFYRVELSSDGSWANPTHRFATSGTQLRISNVAAGSYGLRLGAFSEVSGRWEYTDPVNITVP